MGVTNYDKNIDNARFYGIIVLNILRHTVGKKENFKCLDN